MIGISNILIAVKAPVNFQIDHTNINTNIAASGFCEILREDVVTDIQTHFYSAIHHFFSAF